MKRIFKLLIVLCLSLSVCLSLVACANGHMHLWNPDWSFDKTNHWHTCDGADCEETAGFGEHAFVDGVCKGCGVTALQLEFDGGVGTEESPYIISNSEQLAKMALATEFSYFKVKDGVEELDMSNWTSIRLNGSFDGNGVKLVNLSTRLFTHVGNNEAKDIYVKNFIYCFSFYFRLSNKFAVFINFKIPN